MNHENEIVSGDCTNYVPKLLPLVYHMLDDLMTTIMDVSYVSDETRDALSYALTCVLNDYYLLEKEINNE